MDLRRVVVTGLGTVNPLGCGIDASWERLKAGKSGAARIDSFDVSDLPCKIACQVKRGDGSDGTFNPDDWVEPKDQRKIDDFILYALAATEQALTDADWKPEDPEDQIRTGVIIGSGIGGIRPISDATELIATRGPRRLSPFFITSALINLASGYVSIRYALRGPNSAVVTACSTGSHAIGDAARMIALGDAEVMVAGGTESPISRLGVAAFTACRALSTRFNDDPEVASRPFDRDRDGFVMGEGAGIVVLEELEHARARGARIYGEVIGYGLSGDAYHITSPAPDGDGAYRCMQAALKRANVAPREIDYLNAHSTSTKLGDELEIAAVGRLMGQDAAHLTLSSTKSATGHLLGAAGAVEAIFSLLAMRDGIAPPTINLENQSVDTPVDLVPKLAKPMDIEIAMSNSFGFGGTNACLVFRRLDG